MHAVLSASLLAIWVVPGYFIGVLTRRRYFVPRDFLICATVYLVAFMVWLSIKNVFGFPS